MNRVYQALAQALGCAYFTGEVDFGDAFDPARALRSGLAPLAPNAFGLGAVIAPRGSTIAGLFEAVASGRLYAEAFAIASPRRLAALIRLRHGQAILDDALQQPSPSYSARGGMEARQIAAIVVTIVSGCAVLLAYPHYFRDFLTIALWLVFSSTVLLRSCALISGGPAQAAPPLSDRDLPVYTVLIPLYDEAQVVSQLVGAIDALDYSKGKLDIKLVVEQDDSATISKISTLRLPGRYDVIVVPPGMPRTKARALDVALPCARGDYLAVYDAEDIPARDQLRQAASRFAADPGLDCLQARLTQRNAGDSWLSQLFAVEYSVLFDLVNPGLSALGLPVALGGTSNHFRVRSLRAAGGWDAWNVAEDADLGVRLARLGYRVGALDSDTSEEAPHELENWFRQRVRWQKGWMQSCIVHSRRPLQLVRDLGRLRAWAAMTLLGGGVLSGLLGPYFAADTLWRVFASHFEGGLPWREAVDVGVYLLALGGLLVILLPALVVKRRRRVGTPLGRLALLPVYYLLVAAASVTAAGQLFTRPFYWGKTAHGRSRSALRPSPPPLTRRALLSMD